MEDIRIDSVTLEEFATALLQADGFTSEESDITAKSLILSNLYGHDSHGIIRVPQYIDMRKRNVVKSGAQLIFEKDSPASCVIDADIGLGQVQMPRILDHLIEKSKDQGIVCAAVRNIGHTGRLGEWSEYAARRGRIAMIMNNDNGTVLAVAPPGTKTACTSTNPIAFGIPLSNEDIFSLDMSTSAVAIGKLSVARAADAQAPEGVLQDVNGILTTDPHAFFDGGTILPMGGVQGYKGFGLSMIVEMMSAGLSGGLTSPAGEVGEAVSNVIITLWNPAQFCGLNHMRTQAEKFIDFIRTAEPISPGTCVRLAGDRSKSTYKERLENGIPLSKGLIDKLKNTADIFDIKVPEEF